jgi:lipopolysaccharide cholinephosphotransferase
MKKFKDIINESFNEFALDSIIEIKLKKVLLMILADIDYVCRKENISYLLCAGSVLGAVRHKGIIPWDDDIDIMMFDSEICKLREAINIHFPSKYCFLSDKKFRNDPLKFEKIMLLDTKYVELGCDNLKQPRGIGIDIFPVLGLPNNRFHRWIKGKYFTLISPLVSLHFFAFSISRSNAFKIKSKEDRNLRKFIFQRKLLGLFTFFLPTRVWKWLATKGMFFQDSVLCQFSSIPYGSKRYFGEMHETRLWQDIKYIEFEGEKYPIPVNYHEYLNGKYGPDYMKIPDEHKKQKHFVSEVDFGPYNNILNE